MPAPTGQLAAGCFDGYGQTGVSYAGCDGPQNVQIRNMITAVSGPAYAPGPCAPSAGWLS